MAAATHYVTVNRATVNVLFHITFVQLYFYVFIFMFVHVNVQ